MKKWEEQQRIKQYNKKINTAKSSLSKKSPKVGGVERSIKSKSNSNLVRSSTASTKINDYYLNEKEDLNTIPLYRLLKMYQLQQYAKELISRGYGYDLIKFNYLTMTQLNTLFEEIKVLPGHKTKLLNLIDYINEMLPNISQDFSQYTPQQQYYLQSPSAQSNSSLLGLSNSKSRNNVSNTAVPKSQRSNSQKNLIFNSNNNNNSNATKNFNQTSKNRPVSAKTYSGGPTQNTKKFGQKPQQKYGNYSNNQKDNIYQTFKQTQDVNYLTESEVSQDNFNQQQEEIIDYQKNLEENFNSQYSLNQNQVQNVNKQHNQTQEQAYGNQFQFYDEEEDENQDQEDEYDDDEFVMDQGLQQQLKEIGVDYFDDQNPQDQEYNNDTGNNFYVQENQSFSKTMKKIMEQYQNEQNEEQFQEQFRNLPMEQQQEFYEFIKQEGSKESNQYQNENFEEFVQDDIQQEEYFNQQQQQQSNYYQNQNDEVEIDKDYEYEKFIQDKKNQEIEIEKQKIRKLKELKEQKEKQEQKEIQQNKIKQQKDRSQQESVAQKIKNNLQRRNSGGSIKESDSQKNIQVNKEQNQNQQGVNNFKKTQKKTVQDDIILIPKIDSQNNVSTVIRDNKLLSNIKNNIISNNDQSIIKNVNLEVDKIKNLYLSYDTGKLTSTLINLDIEEMCFCLGAATLKHIQHGANPKNKLPNTSIAVTQSQLHDIKEVPENEQDTQIPNKSLKQSNLSQIQQSKLKIPQPPIIEQNYSEVSDNPVDEPTMMQDSAVDQEIDVNKYMQGTGNNFFKSQLIKNQSEIQNILKESLFLMQNTQRDTQNQGGKKPEQKINKGDQELSEASNIFNELEETNSDQEDQLNKKNIQKIKKNSLINYSGNQSLANRLSEKDAYDCDMELSEDEIEESTSKSNNLVNIQQSASQSDVQNCTSNNQNQQHHSQTLEQLQLTQSIATKSDLYQYKNKEKSLLEQSQTQSIDGSQVNQDDEYLQKGEEISMTNQEIQEIQRKMQQLQNESQNMEIYDSQLDKDLENISYQQCDQNQEQSLVQSQLQQSMYSLQKKSQHPLQKSSLNFSIISQYSTVVQNKQSIQAFKQNKKLFDKTYNEANNDPLLNAIPDVSLLQNFCKNIILQSKMEKEVVIIALVYIEKLLIKSQQRLNQKNWRRILFTALIMASKIWDDQSFENENFAEAFSQYTTIQINEFERVFLDFLDYRLQVNNYDYAKYYFILRTFSQKNKKSFPLKPLDLQTILRLQNGSNKAESRLKEMYEQPLNKSF